MYIWSDRKRFEGQWVFGMMSGVGLLEEPDGTTFSGQFSHNKPHGQGLVDSSNCRRPDFLLQSHCKQFIFLSHNVFVSQCAAVGSGCKKWMSGPFTGCYYQGEWMSGQIQVCNFIAR
jgi:hypothetical protein